MYVIDTNIFLEILLEQAKKETCKHFLKNHAGELALSDFSLHSIGVILFRSGSAEAFENFARDVLPKVKIVTLSTTGYVTLPKEAARKKLDFDDAYQWRIAEENDFTLVTMDQDFKAVQQDIHVMFL